MFLRRAVTIVFLLLLSTTLSNAFLFPILLKKRAITVTKKKLCIKKIQQQKAAAAAALTIGGAASGFTLLQQRQQSILNDKYNIYQPEEGSLLGQTIVITGGSSGLGLESSKRLAVAGANIIVTARSDNKGSAAIQQIRAYLEKKNKATIPEQQRLDYKVLNMDDLQSMNQSFTDNKWDDVPIVDVLLNNAGVMAIPQRETTVDGYERQIQSNHLGHFLLTSLLSDKLSKRARIINVSSSANQFAFTGLKFNYLWKAESGYGPWRSYGQSKLANIYFTTELQRRIDAIPTLEWSAATLHPGVVPTNLGRYSGNNDDLEAIPSTVLDNDSDKENTIQTFLGSLANTINQDFKSIEQGASTQVWLASGAEFQDIGGKFYDRCKQQQLRPFALNKEDGKRLWNESEDLLGRKFDLPSLGTSKDNEIVDMVLDEEDSSNNRTSTTTEDGI